MGTGVTLTIWPPTKPPDRRLSDRVDVLTCESRFNAAKACDRRTRFSFVVICHLLFAACYLLETADNLQPTTSHNTTVIDKSDQAIDL
jgi:hypothetical protein